MTTITLRTAKHIERLEVVVNGHAMPSGTRITSIKKVRASRWEGIAGGQPFVIFGGKQAGGAANDWFVQWDVLAPGHTFHVKSAREAVRMIDNS